MRQQKPPLSECEKCCLDQQCLSPQMKWTGEGRKKILLLGEAPGKNEDEQGSQFVGQSGKLLREFLLENHIRMDKDCWKTNAIRCRPPNNRTPSLKEINCCKGFLHETLKELKPEKVFTFGKTALQAYMSGRESVTDVDKWIGRMIPDREWECWVYPMYHPAFLIRNGNDDVLFDIFFDQLAAAVEHKPDISTFAPHVITQYKDPYSATIYLEGLLTYKGEVAFDIETIGISPYREGAKILSIAFSNGRSGATAFPMFEDKDFQRTLRKVLQGEMGKIAHNMKFEDKWIAEKLGYRVKNWVADTLVQTHVLDNRAGVTGLKFQGGVRYGLIGYDNAVKKYIKDMSKCPIDDMLYYNGMDAMVTYRLYKDMQQETQDHKGCALFHEGIQALSQMEMNGIQINTQYYKNSIIRLSKEIKKAKKDIQEHPDITDKWGKEFNPNSVQQLQKFLFHTLGEKPVKETKKGNPSVDISVLESIKHPVIQNIVTMRKLEKISNTFLSNILDNTHNGLLHPSFDLHTARSYRSSSSDPNFQNIPKRDTMAQKIIRTGITARKGRMLMEVDYSGIEVRISACYHQDPAMLSYIHDPSTDMHRDQAKELFLKDEVTKEERYLAKNGFVFPAFYGSYFAEIAPRIWTDLPKDTKKHLADQGITKYRQFETHVQDVEDRFWNERFKVYNQWKKDQWDLFQKRGYIVSHTGFRYPGPMRRNMVLNYPIQGSAFHCLLWSVIQVNKWLKAKKMSTLIAGQIHDSMFLDVVPEELEEVYATVKRIMCIDIRKEWQWIIVPLDIEAMVSDIDGNWYKMKKYPSD